MDPVLILFQFPDVFLQFPDRSRFGDNLVIFVDQKHRRSSEKIIVVCYFTVKTACCMDIYPFQRILNRKFFPVFSVFIDGYADEFYLLFRYEYSANFFYRLYKRIRKYNGFVTGLTQNVEELLKSDTARLMLANSEFLILLNQASTDREELAALLNISENQLSYITNVSVGSGLIRCSGNIVPFENTFPKNTDLYKLMTTKPGES